MSNDQDNKSDAQGPREASGELPGTVVPSPTGGEVTRELHVFPKDVKLSDFEKEHQTPSCSPSPTGPSGAPEQDLPAERAEPQDDPEESNRDGREFSSPGDVGDNPNSPGDAKGPNGDAPPAESDPTSDSEELDRAVLKDAIKELLEKINSLNEELTEERNRKLRLAADMENLKRRFTKNQEMALNRVKTESILEFLPVMDHLEMALSHTEDNASVASLKEGVQMVMKQFTNSLVRMGVESVDALGEQFDPTLHEAMAQEESALYASGTVISQWQKGYKLDGILIRPARVVVSKGPGPEESVTDE